MADSEPPLVARHRIDETFREQGRRVFSQQELFEIADAHLDQWRLPDDFPEQQKSAMLQSNGAWEIGSLTPKAVLLSLVRHSVLQRIRLPFPHRGYARYTWGDSSTYELLQSLDQDGYFTHYTAIQLHGLTEQIPKAVYFNVEQGATGGGGQLTQERIARAFRGKPRVTGNVIEYDERRIYKLNGMNTGRLGVVTLTLDDTPVPIRVTNIERTLIDVAVRPMYAGGVSEVAKAYVAAAGRCSVNKIVAYLRKLNFTYPYHQAIGYYLERAGLYGEDQLDLLASFPMPFDFYLTYQLTNTDFNERWRLFVPKGF